MQICEGCVHSVDSSLRLLEYLVRVLKAVEHDRIRLDAIPSLSTSRVLNEVDPTISLGDLLMLLPVPLSHGDVERTAQSSENIQLVVEVVEHDQLRMLLTELHQTTQA